MRISASHSLHFHLISLFLKLGLPSPVHRSARRLVWTKTRLPRRHANPSRLLSRLRPRPERDHDRRPPRAPGHRRRVRHSCLSRHSRARVPALEGACRGVRDVRGRCTHGRGVGLVGRRSDDPAHGADMAVTVLPHDGRQWRMLLRGIVVHRKGSTLDRGGPQDRLAWCIPRNRRPDTHRLCPQRRKCRAQWMEHELHYRVHSHRGPTHRPLPTLATLFGACARGPNEGPVAMDTSTSHEPIYLDESERPDGSHVDHRLFGVV